jgi:hypothetical protein
LEKPEERLPISARGWSQTINLKNNRWTVMELFRTEVRESGLAEGKVLMAEKAE